MHLGYDLLAGRLVDVRVADQHTAEAFALFVIGPGDVLVADRGYSRRGQWAYALTCGADPWCVWPCNRFPCSMSEERAWTWWPGSKR